MTDSHLTRISYEDINSDYCRAKYGDFNVIIMKSNGYINATKLCNDCGKKFDNWFDDRRNKDMITEFEEEIYQSQGYLTKNNWILFRVYQETFDNRLNGIYVHPKLVSYIASWASNAFALKISDIVNNYLLHKEV